MVIHHCYVPDCSSNSEKDPDKIFVTIPKNSEIRANWFRAIVPDQDIKKTGSLYVCEDHFDLPNDAENWMYYKTMGQCLRMKKDSVPQIKTKAVCHMTESCKKRKQENIEMFESSSSRRKFEPRASTSNFIDVTPIKAESSSFHICSPCGRFCDGKSITSPINGQKYRIQKTQTYLTSHFRHIPLSTVRLKSDARPSILPHDTSSSTKSVQSRNEPTECQQEFEVKCEPSESEYKVEDQSQDIDNTNSETDAVTVKIEDLIEFEYQDIKKIEEEEQPKLFDILWHGSINLPNDCWTTSKIQTEKKFIVIIKCIMTQDEVLVHQKQILIQENLTVSYFVLNKAFNTHCMPVKITSVEEIEKVLEYFDGIPVCEVDQDPSNNPVN